MESDELLQQLHKLSAGAPPSDEALELVLATLWSTRKKGLGPHQRRDIQSLLNLPSPKDLDPVLACLRLVIRRSVHENLTDEDMKKLFPRDFSIDLQRSLVVILLKHQNQWKEEASSDQPLWQRTRVSCQAKSYTPLALAPLPASSSACPPQDGSIFHSNRRSLDGLTSVSIDPDFPRMVPISSEQDNGSLDELAMIPHFKSMSWTFENRNSPPANRVVIINLTLQDHTKLPSGEKEVSFRVSRDTLEAMLRSMAYMKEQLENYVIQPGSPLQKKQRK